MLEQTLQKRGCNKEMKDQNPPQTTNDLVTDLLNYFRQFNPIPKTYFVVAGYDDNDPFVFGVNIIK